MIHYVVYSVVEGDLCDLVLTTSAHGSREKAVQRAVDIALEITDLSETEIRRDLEKEGVTEYAGIIVGIREIDAIIGD